MYLYTIIFWCIIYVNLQSNRREQNTAQLALTNVQPVALVGHHLPAERLI